MDFELKPIKQLPKTMRERGKSDYDTILKQFATGDSKFAEVIPKKDIKPMSIVTALRLRIKGNEEFKNVTVRTRKIDKEVKVYLQKK